MFPASVRGMVQIYTPFGIQDQTDDNERKYR
jgi:hypothetical protein